MDKKYEIVWYNRFGCCTRQTYIKAKSEEEAEEIFYRHYDKNSFKDCIEEISEYEEMEIKFITRDCEIISKC